MSSYSWSRIPRRGGCTSRSSSVSNRPRDPRLISQELRDAQELSETFGEGDLVEDDGDHSTDQDSGEREGEESCLLGQPVTQKQFADLLLAVKRSNDTIAKVQEEIVKSREETTETIEKRCKRERSYQFRSKGNKIQFEFNEDVADLIESAGSSIERELARRGKQPLSKDLRKAQQALEEGKNVINTRQKHIKIADRSDHGWSTVAEYQDDELASDSEDERKLNRAEKAAERKAAKTKKRKAEAASRAAKFRKKEPLSAPRDVFNNSSSHSVRGRGGGPAGPSRLGPCHNCLEMGHLKKDCTKPTLSQWYPLRSSASCTGVSEHDGACGVEEGPITCTCMLESSSYLPGSRQADLLINGFESEVGWGIGLQSHPFPKVKGRLKQHFGFWVEHLKASSVVLTIISEGYKLPLIQEPPKFRRANDESTFENVQFVTDAVAELLDAHCIDKTHALPHICSPLLVVKNSSGKKRLVINLHFLNQYLQKLKFKYEDLRTALDLLSQEDYVCKFDLKSGYHHIDIHPEHTKFLGFEWGGAWYVFNVLPFGLSTACYTFTKVL